jgi:hypothetical protein
LRFGCASLTFVASASSAAPSVVLDVDFGARDPDFEFGGRRFPARWWRGLGYRRLEDCDANIRFVALAPFDRVRGLPRDKQIHGVYGNVPGSDPRPDLFAVTFILVTALHLLQ